MIDKKLKKQNMVIYNITNNYIFFNKNHKNYIILCRNQKRINKKIYDRIILKQKKIILNSRFNNKLLERMQKLIN